MTDVRYRTTDSQDLSGAQAAAWLALVQQSFGPDATSQSVQSVSIYRVGLNKASFKASVTLELSGSADDYIAAKPSQLVSYDGTTAVWTEKRTLRALGVSPDMTVLAADIHTGIALGKAYQLQLERGSPNKSHLSYEATATAHDWAVAEAAGSPLGSFLGVG